MNRLLALASAAGDRVNPVAVKEFRQAVQSRWVTVVFMLFLLVNLAIVGGYLMLSPDAATSTTGGRDIFIALVRHPADSPASVSCHSTRACGSRSKRNDANIDLFFITTITPGAIVRGKYLSAMALTLLIFSACMPFMILTYLLRGIDLPTIFTVLAVGFMYSAFANALGIFAGSLSGSWLLRGLVAVGLLIWLLYTAAGFVSMVGMSLHFGMGRIFPHDAWSIVATMLFLELLAIGLLYVFSVALLSPKPANRMFVPRIYITAVWLVTGVVAAVWSVSLSRGEAIIVWVIYCCVAFTFMTVVSLGERDAWTTRVKRIIPKNVFVRLFAFVFYSGAAGGIVWSTILFWLSIAAATMLVNYMGWAGHVDFRECCDNVSLVFGYILCYCLTTAVICKVLLKRFNLPNLSVLAAFLAVLVCLGPYLVAFFLFGDRWWNSIAWYLIGSPMVLTMNNKAAAEAARPFLLTWLTIVILLSLPWTIGQWRRFVPLESQSISNSTVGG